MSQEHSPTTSLYGRGRPKPCEVRSVSVVDETRKVFSFCTHTCLLHCERAQDLGFYGSSCAAFDSGSAAPRPGCACASTGS